MEDITIFDIKEAATKTGKNAGTVYLGLDTDKGRVSCFESSLFDKIKEVKGMEISVEIQTNGEFKNLIGFNSVIGPGKEKTNSPKENQYRTPDAIMRTDAYKLAVDMCIAGLVTKESLDEVAEKFYTSIKG